jgi:hypothetical protein
VFESTTVLEKNKIKSDYTQTEVAFSVIAEISEVFFFTGATGIALSSSIVAEFYICPNFYTVVLICDDTCISFLCILLLLNDYAHVTVRRLRNKIGCFLK